MSLVEHAMANNTENKEGVAGVAGVAVAENNNSADNKPEGETPTPAEQGNGKVVEQTNDWFYHDGIKGEGEKPEWLKTDKYKTVSDQAKAYAEVEKKLGAFKGAPDEYDLTLPNNPDIKLSKEDPLIKDFLESAKDKGATQEYVSELLEYYASAMTAFIPDPKKEMEKLGSNAQEEVQILSQWASSKLSPDEYKTYENLVTTAESVRLFEKLRMIATRGEVAQPSTSKSTHETEEQVRKLVHDPRYATDENFRSEVKRRMAAAVGVK